MPIEGFRDWLDTPQGQYVLHWEQQKHDQLLADVFGFNAVQIGLLEVDYLHANRMPFRFRCGSPDYPPAPGREELLADLHHLPFAANSVDLVVLPHALEFDPNPHQILREVERILVPEGQVVITGFNPFSLWGIKRAFKRRSQQPPWAGRYISVPRLKDWFALLGFETRAGAFGCYAPPLEQGKWLRRYRFMEPAGDRWWPYAGAVYIMQAIKRQHGMRLITPLWSDRMARAKALVGVARKNQTLSND
ncbi:MAG: class I SAM-dependent methyltransferase [Rhodocyclaceae bacterium]|nr:MAG: class I SAM-dependent methyltransferase [Rhodocyclaceae bacterium]